MRALRIGLIGLDLAASPREKRSPKMLGVKSKGKMLKGDDGFNVVSGSSRGEWTLPLCVFDVANSPHACIWLRDAVLSEASQSRCCAPFTTHFMRCHGFETLTPKSHGTQPGSQDQGSLRYSGIAYTVTQTPKGPADSRPPHKPQPECLSEAPRPSPKSTPSGLVGILLVPGEPWDNRRNFR
eukprot:gene15971-4831_t